MKFFVILENAPDCELGRVECNVDAPETDPNADVIVNRAIMKALGGLMVGIGDTIKIVGVLEDEACDNCGHTGKHAPTCDVAPL